MAASAASTANVSPKTRPGATRFVILGGFLGAGKTTLAQRLGADLKASGQSAAYITNDQGTEVLDAQILGRSFPTIQVTGGSFSSQFDALAAASARLVEGHSPEVIVAECVGGAADFAATVASPLSRLHGKEFAVAPFSVLVDPALAAQVFNVNGPANFSENILYLYRQQIEEADLVLINKIDVTKGEATAAVRARLEREFPGKMFFEISARTGQGFSLWRDAVLNGAFQMRPSRIDSKLHTAAQTLLGSLNCTAQLSALKGFQCNPVMRELARAIQSSLDAARIPLAHLKMTLKADVDVDGMATLNLVHKAPQPELGQELPEPIERGRLSLSLRAEAKPDLLHAVVTDALTHLCALFPGLFVRLSHMEHFRPGGAAAARAV
jgi:G3E family GTPase